MSLPRRLAPLGLAVCLLAAATPALGQSEGATPRGEPVHAITAFGLEPVYGPGFEQWAYINPDAPGGGILRASAFGTFDTLNQYTLRGDPAAGLGLLYSSLGVGSADETSVVYANLAESYELAPDRSWLIITLRDDIAFHDGEPITADDVIFTYDTLINEAHPGYRLQVFAGVEGYETLDERTVRVTFSDTTDPEVPLGPASIPVLPRHDWEGREFGELTMQIPVGSGPYRIAAVEPGQWIEYEKVADWWGSSEPRYDGMYNFERLRFDYYRDNTVRYEALKAGEFDYIGVTDPRQWDQGFDGVEAVDDGTLVMSALPYDGPETFAGIHLNIRQPPFDDIRVREAVIRLFDFEAINRAVLFGLYERNTSYFQNSEFAATGLPDGGELALLDSVRDLAHDEAAVFGEAVVPPVTSGRGNDRSQLRIANRLLQAAGYEVVDGRMTHRDTGQPISFELIYGDPTVERILLPYQETLARAGIEMRLRFLDGAQWQSVYNNRDYSAIIGFRSALYPPGREMADFYGSATADVVGSQNATGIADPALDQLIAAMIASQTWDDRVEAGRAVDRYLRSLWLAVPLYFDPTIRIVHWDMLGWPERRPRFGFSISGMWWYDDTNTAALFGNR